MNLIAEGNQNIILTGNPTKTFLNVRMLNILILTTISD